MENKMLNYDYWMDFFLNSWEHFDDSLDAATFMVEELSDSNDLFNKESLIVKTQKLVEYWFNNEANLRVEIQMNYHKNVEDCEEKMKHLVDRFLKV